MTRYRYALGQAGEAVAVQYFKTHGYRILARNFRTQFGEVDVIVQPMDAPDLVVIVEVKTYRTLRIDPIWSITKKKYQRLVHMATVYQGLNQCDDCQFRFDLVLVKDGGVYRHIVAIEPPPS